MFTPLVRRTFVHLRPAQVACLQVASHAGALESEIMQMRAALRRSFNTGASESKYESGWDFPAARRMFLVGFAVRLLYLTLAHTYRFRVIQDHFQFGWEMGRIARSLATGHGYSDPFDGHTGPTAWTPPIYPLLMAATFRLFGVYSSLSAWVLLAINSLFSAATAPGIFELAERCYGKRHDGRRVALWSGWLWALYPAAMQYAVKWPWDMAMTAFFFTWVLVFGVRLRTSLAEHEIQSLPVWIGFGLYWGTIALLNSSLLLFLPFQAAWILWPFWRATRLWLSPAVLASLMFLACLAPWVARNYRVFHAFVPLRANFGAELYMAVLPSHNGFPWGSAVPIGVDSPELLRYARMGEVAYSHSQGERGKAMMKANPKLYLGQVLLRIQFFWCSVPHPYDHGLMDETLREANYAFLSVSGLLGLALSLRRRVLGARLFAAAFAVLPVTYYLITVQARFRHPLEPLITIFSVYLFQNADRKHLWSTSSLPFQGAASPKEQVL